MKIILLQHVKNIGKAGDVKNVSDGYARNFLLPKKLAEVASVAVIKKWEGLKEKKRLSDKKDIEMLHELAKKLDRAKVIIKAKEKNGKLFGSIGAKEIAAKLKKQNIEINENKIMVKQPIKEVGEKNVIINLAQGIKATIGVAIEAE